MNEEQIILLAIMATVVVVALLFILRARKFRRQKALIEAASETDPDDRVIDLEPEDNSLRNQYLLKHICRIASPLKKRKQIYVSIEHHEILKKVSQVIGGGEVTITRYVDNILYNHFEENKDIIDSLYRENYNELFAND